MLYQGHPIKLNRKNLIADLDTVKEGLLNVLDTV